MFFNAISAHKYSILLILILHTINIILSVCIIYTNLVNCVSAKVLECQSNNY